MKRRHFLISALAGAAGLKAQQPITGQPTNLDQHGDMPMPGNVDRPTSHIMEPPRSPRVIRPHAAAGPQPGMVPVTTRSYDNTRSGCNLKETILTPANVGQLQKLDSYQIHDDARGLEAQPLIVPAVTLADGRKRDLLILASMGGTVYAYDAHDSQKLYWSVNLGDPVIGSRQIDGWNINENWSILSTPVVDVETNTLYCVSWSSPDGTGNWQNAVHTFHSLSLKDGSHAVPALSLESATYQPPNGLPLQTFKGSQRKQRASLMLATISGRKTVFVAFGTIQETSATARGWILAIDTALNAIGAAFATTSRYSGAGIWMAGQGLCLDAQGYLYALTGNGSFDAKTEWGECFLKLKYTPAPYAHLTGDVTSSYGTTLATVNSISAPQGVLSVVDWWSPFSDSARAGGPATGDHITMDRGGGWDDMDLGSGGVVLIPELGLLAGAGKDGILYVMKANAMGQTKPADFANPTANYAKLEAPPIWFTYYNPASPTPTDFTTLNQIYQGRTHHAHSTPVVFKDATGYKLFCWGENGNLRAWSIDQTGRAKYLACSVEVASDQSTVPPGGMPGGVLSLCANGTANGLIIACVPQGDANRQVSQGFVAIYSASNYGRYQDGSGSMPLLWKSQPYTYNKFNLAVVSGGKIYVPTYSGAVDVYGI